MITYRDDDFKPHNTGLLGPLSKLHPQVTEGASSIIGMDGARRTKHTLNTR